jgi:hypothetical protein
MRLAMQAIGVDDAAPETFIRYMELHRSEGVVHSEESQAPCRHRAMPNISVELIR